MRPYWYQSDADQGLCEQAQVGKLKDGCKDEVAVEVEKTEVEKALADKPKAHPKVGAVQGVKK